MDRARLINTETGSAQRVLASTFDPAILKDPKFQIACDDKQCAARVAFHSVTRVEGLSRKRKRHFSTFPKETHRAGCPIPPRAAHNRRERLKLAKALEEGLPVVINLNIDSLSPKADWVSAKRTHAAVLQRLGNRPYVPLSVHDVDAFTALTARVREYDRPSLVLVAYKSVVRDLKNIRLDHTTRTAQEFIRALMIRTSKRDTRDDRLKYSPNLPMTIVMAFNKAAKPADEPGLTRAGSKVEKKDADFLEETWLSPTIDMHGDGKFYPFTGRRGNLWFPWAKMRLAITSDNPEINEMLATYERAGAPVKLVAAFAETDLRRVIHQHGGRYTPGTTLEIPVPLTALEQIATYKPPRTYTCEAVPKVA